MPNVKHRSVSQMNTYTSCPRKYRFAYIDKDINIMRDNANTTLGLALHKAQEFNYRQKIESKKDLPLEEINAFMLNFLMTAFKNNVENPNFFPFKYGKKGTGEALMAQASEMLKLHYEQIMVNTQPLFVELPIVLKINGQEFLQYIDLIDDQYIIRDLKTSGSRMNESAIDINTQLIGYSIGFRAKFGRKEKGVQLDVIVKTKTPQIQQLRGETTDTNVARFLESLEQVNRGIENAVFPPVDNPMICSWCDFRELCQDNNLPDAKVLAEKLKKIEAIKKSKE